ncbi:MAG: hypothetical protein M5R36_16310, partial [Deltaproteobacteria bacterium]|nr:hypothetical protein [Deltaproteobacteria bacterium]
RFCRSTHHASNPKEFPSYQPRFERTNRGNGGRLSYVVGRMPRDSASWRKTAGCPVNRLFGYPVGRMVPPEAGFYE